MTGGGAMAVDQNNGQIENYEDLLEDYSHFAPPAADEVLQGTVLAIKGKDVIIDFGYKSEGLCPIEQFQTPTGQTTVQVGDVVDVMIDHGEQPEGYVLLSTPAPPASASGTTSIRLTRNSSSSPAASSDASRAASPSTWASRPSCPARRPTRAPFTISTP